MTRLVQPRSLSVDTQALRSGELELHAYVDELCDRIDRVEPRIFAYVDEPHRRSRLHQEADALTRRWPDPDTRPVLFGAALAVKDIMRVDGLATRAGSRVDPVVLSGAQAVIIDRLRSAGAVVIGKTVTAEFAGAAAGPTCNPYDVARTPGGSSSGSAAAVAAGTATVSLGTQTIGSVIRPAAYCGIVGFKPTFGRIATDGVIAHSASFDTPGVFAGDVRGVAVAAGVVWDRWSSTTASNRIARLGVPVGAYLEQVDADARRVFSEDCERLRSAGCAVAELDVLPDLAEVLDDNWVVNRYELARTHEPWFDRHRAGYRAETIDAIESGRGISRAGYRASAGHLAAFRESMDDRLSRAGVDAIVAPSALGAAPIGLGHTGDPAMALPWTYAGLPAVTIPSGRSDGGMPLGLQLVGRRGADEALLSLAAGLHDVLRH